MVVVANYYLVMVVPTVVDQELVAGSIETAEDMVVVPIAVDWELVAAPIEIAEDMFAEDIQNCFLFVVDILFEAMIAGSAAVAELAMVTDYKMVVEVYLADRSQYFFLSINTYAKKIA